MSAKADRRIYAFRRNLVVAASAGTGKTHRLTGLYAMATLGLTSLGAEDERTGSPPVSPSRIIATTFSRAAAREIGERVAESLAGVAEGGASLGRHDDALRARLATLAAPPSREELRERARRALAELPVARLDTVHGLAARIVLDNAVALDVPPGARMLDEGESAELDAQVVDESLHAALSAGGEAAEAARQLLDVTGSLSACRLETAALLGRLDEEGATPEELAIADHEEDVAALVRRVLDVADLCVRSGSPRIGPLARAAEVALRAFSRTGGEAEAVAVERALVAWIGARADKTAAGEALGALREELGRATNAEKGRALSRLVCGARELGRVERSVLALLADARRRLLRERAARRVLSFGDVLRLARDGLRDVPAISARVRASHDVLLVDEFQDTSPVQRDLVYLLRERPDAAARRRPLEVPAASDLAPAGLFLVGDRKQSIYGFRGADVGVFARLCAELAGEAAVAALEMPPEMSRGPAVADFVALSESHRAGPRLCAFVNAVAAADFGVGPTTRDFEIRYGAAEALVAAVQRPTDRVTWVRDGGEVPDGADAFVGGARGALRAALVAAAAVEREIGAGLCPRDVAVLTRRRATVPLVEIALRRRGVPHVVAGRALFDTMEVRDLSALLRLLVDPSERRALATVLRGPMVSLSDDALLLLAEPGRGLDPGSLLGARGAREGALAALDRARLEAFRARFLAVRPALLRLPAGAAVREALRAFDLDLAVAALPRAPARLGNLDRVADLARRRGGTLAAFSRWLDGAIDSEADGDEAVVFSEDDDAVRVTTIHASKGLDFPAVVLLDLEAAAAPRTASVGLARRGDRLALLVKHRGPGLTRLPSPTLTAALEEQRAREQAERRRLSYVALTRARDRLVLVQPAMAPRPGSLHGTLDGLGEALTPLVSEAIDARELLAGAGGAVAPSAVEAGPIPARPARPALAPTARVALATTPLGTFQGCPRRFRLRHLLGLEEPVSSGQLELFELPVSDDRPDPIGGGAEPEPDGTPTLPTEDGDPRALGRAAHRVLELWPREAWGAPPDEEALCARLVAEGLGRGAAARVTSGLSALLAGPIGRRARAARRFERELPFLVSIEGERGAPALDVRGAMDLLVESEGVAWVIDYKLAAPGKSLDPWAFQLRTYALAARRLPGAPAVRAGVAFLLGGSGEPRWLPGSGEGGTLSPDEHAAHEADLRALSRSYAAARFDDRWEPVPRPRCEALRCGFLTACHGGRRPAR